MKNQLVQYSREDFEKHIGEGATPGIDQIPDWFKDAMKDAFWEVWKASRDALNGENHPVVPQDVLEALQKVARIRLDMNDFDGDRRGIADCLGDAEEALIEVVNRRAAMLAAAPQSPGSEPATVPGKWIPVSERMPDETQPVIVVSEGGVVQRTVYQFCEGVWSDWYGMYDDVNVEAFTHWMSLPAAPQETNS